MSIQETDLYREQLISGYISEGRLCPVLRMCEEVLPDGEFRESVGSCLTSLTTGEGMDKKHSLRDVLRTLEGGDPVLGLIHDVIAESEESGRDCREVLGLLREAAAWPSMNRRKHGRDQRRPGHRTINKEIERDGMLWVVGMAVYTAVWGFYEAVRRSAALTDGMFRQEILNLARNLSGGGTRDVCRAFLPAPSHPEIRFCLMVCLRMDPAEPERELQLIRSACRERNALSAKSMKKKRKGSVAALIAAVWVLVMIAGIGLTDTNKEKRLKTALSQAMSVTVGETAKLYEKNQMLAVFMQNMLKNVDDDIDLTVRICDMDEREKVMDVEAVGEYDLGFGGRRRVSVRRRIAF